MQAWQLQEAKARLSELIKTVANKGPQEISVRGKTEVVVISKTDYDKLIGSEEDFYTFMRNSPLKGISIDTKRDKSLGRDFEF